MRRKTNGITKIVAGLVLLMLCTIPMVAARDSLRLKLVQKDPTTWETVPGGSYGTVVGWQRYGRQYIGGFRVMTTLDVLYFQSGWRSIAPLKTYTLVYYGDETHNDEWPYVTCISQGNSGHIGYLRMYDYTETIEWSSMLHDGIPQKLWLVLSQDVDCTLGQFVDWNPSEYLFETRTI